MKQISESAQELLPAKKQVIMPEIKEPLLVDTLSAQDHGIAEQDNDIKAISRELLSKHNIEAKTELSHDEIIFVTKLRFLENRYGVRNVHVLVESLETLRVSMDRKSRREFIDALQTENRNSQATGFWGGFKKMFTGGPE